MLQGEEANEHKKKCAGKTNWKEKAAGIDEVPVFLIWSKKGKNFFFPI